MRRLKNKSFKLAMTDSDLLAMYRCFLYTKMGLRNDEKRPTDKECLDWLQNVMAQAEHRIEPPLLMYEHPAVECRPLPVSKVVPVIRRFDILCGLPNWRKGEETL